MSTTHRSNRGPIVVLGVAELLIGMVLMLWAAVLILSALLVAAVSHAHRGLTDHQIPPIRRTPPNHRVQPGSRRHRPSHR